MKKLLFAFLVPLAVLACGQKDNPSGGGGDSEPSTSGLSKPANVKLVEATETTLTFSWDAVSGADSYSYKLTASGVKTVTGSVTSTSVKIESLKASTEYTFQVLAMAGDKKSLYSNALKAKTTGGSVDPGDEVPIISICVDQPIVITTSATPVLGSSGLIQVYDGDGKVVDAIDMADMAKVTVREDGIMLPKEAITADTKYNTFMDAIQGTTGAYRVVHYTPIRVNGKSVEIRLHNGALAFGKKYTISADASCFGEPVTRADFALAVKSAPTGSTVKVAQDGSADFCTVQGALTYVATKTGKNDAVTIEIGEGTYPEILYLCQRNNVTLKGVSAEKTVIAYANSELWCTSTGSNVSSKPAVGNVINKPGGRSLFLVEGCDMLTLENLNIQNLVASTDGQAECLYFNGDGKKLVIEGCSLISWQDTFETKGSVYVHNSLIAGHVDFIWGNPSACLFENCEIRSRESGRYIVQARCKSGDKGFVFLNCRLTVESGVSNVNLARANNHQKNEIDKGQPLTYDNVTYINCNMTGVATAGWHTDPAPNPGTATATDGWKEYGSKDVNGNALSLSGRSSCARILTAAEAEPFSSKQAVLGW